MSLKYFSFIVILVLIMQSSQSQSSPLEVPPFEFIQAAITNFSKGGRLFKQDSVFSVWVSKLAKNEDLLVVRIGKSSTKILVTADTKVGSKGRAPSRYFEKDGKLFFWWDNNFALTQEALTIFAKYNLLEDDQGGILKVPSAFFDDSQKGAHYYYCKNNPKRFKKVITNIAAGYYDPPRIKCNNVTQ
jgi:hypothetical protein